MPFAETVVKGPVGSLMNRWSSHRIVRACSEHRCKGFQRVSGSIRYLRAHSAVRLSAQGANRGGGQAANSNCGCAGAEVGAQHPGQQGRPPQPMGAGRSARSAVRRRRLLNRFGGHDAAAVPGPGGQDPVVAQEMEPGAGGPEPPASPVVPSQRAGDGGSHPTTAF